MMPEQSLIADAKYLDEDFIPSKLLFRDEQINELAFIRSSIMDHQRPASDTILMGGPGTGKTALLRFLLAQSRGFLTRAPNLKVRVAYIDCNLISNERTFWINMASELKIYYTSTTSLDQVRSSVMEQLEEYLMLIMLDEIDTLSLEHPNVLDAATNTLARAKGVTIVAAANRKDWKKSLGQKNTFNPKTITCREYNKDQLTQICLERIIHGLRREAVEDEVVDLLATRAFRLGGDARKLIKMLHIAVELAELRGKRRVGAEEAREACAQIDDESHFLADSLISKSHDIHAVLLATHYLNELQVDEGEFGVRSVDILKQYEAFILSTEAYDQEPLKYRSVMDLLQKLQAEALIDRTRASRRGNVWYYEINTEYISGEEITRILGRICPYCKEVIDNHP